MTNHANALIPDPGEPDQWHVPAAADPGTVDRVLTWLTTWITNPDNTPTALAVALGLALAVNVIRRRRAAANTERSADALTPLDRTITRLTAGIATFVVALGMWQFFTDVIHVHWSVRLIAFFFIELGILDAARRATRHLYRHGNLGRAHRAVFVLAGISASLSAVHADSTDLRLFRLAAAFVAAYMWYQNLIEQRDILHHRDPGKYPEPTSRGIPWRRIGVTLGLVESTSISVSEVATLRRMDRLSRLLNHFHNTVAANPKPGRIKRLYIAWLGWRVMRQTQAACKWIDLAENPEVREKLLRRLSIVRGIVKATSPDAVTADGWSDVTQIRTADADRDRHVIDVDVTTDAPTRTVTHADAPTVTAPKTPTVTRQAPTPVNPQPVTEDADATQAAVTTDAGNDGDATDAPTTRRPVTVIRTTDLVPVRPLSRDLIDPRLRDWTVEQIRDYAAGKARQIVSGGGTKMEGMQVYLLLCMALGVEPAGTWMAKDVGGSQALARTNKPKWLAQLAVDDAEQILLAEHQRIVAEIAEGGDVRA